MDPKILQATVEKLYAKYKELDSSVRETEATIFGNTSKKDLERKKSWAPFTLDVLAAEDFQTIPGLMKRLAGAILSLRQVSYADTNHVADALHELLNAAEYDNNGQPNPELDPQVWAIRVRTKNCTMEEAIDQYWDKLLMISLQHMYPDMDTDSRAHQIYEIFQGCGHIPGDMTYEEAIAGFKEAIKQDILEAYNAVGSQWS